MVDSCGQPIHIFYITIILFLNQKVFRQNALNFILEGIVIKVKLIAKCLLIALMLSISIGISSASVQSFESSIGTIEIDIPYTVEPSEYSSGDSLQLVKSGTTKPIISINLWDSAMYKQIYPTFQEFAESFIGTGHTFEEMTTNDGKPMLFNALQEGVDRDGDHNYTFRGYIDDSEENGKYVVIHAPNNVIYQGSTIATYTKDQFAAICKSFVVK